MRTLSSLGHYVATTDARGVQIHQYFSGRLTAGDLTLDVETDYPWSEVVTVRVQTASTARRAISLRLPGWCNGHQIRLNGEGGVIVTDKGYAIIERIWQPGDVIELTLPMPATWVEAHPAVESVRGQVSLQRGPITFCVESVDLPEGISPDWIVVDPSKPVVIEPKPELLGGCVIAKFEAKALEHSRWSNRLYRRAGESKPDQRIEVTAVPYAVWCNRGAGAMRVWLRGG